MDTVNGRRRSGSTATTTDGLSSIERAVAVLERFASSEGADLGVSEIARDLALPKAVVHRILSSLRLRGYVDLDPATRRYRLGPAILRLSQAYLKRLDIRDLARPAMEGLARTTNETVTLSVRAGGSRIYVHQVVPESDVRMVVEVGRPFPLHAGSTSKAFLAFVDGDEVHRVLAAPLEQMTEATITNPERLRAELEAIRRRGFAVSRGERQRGAASVAAPVFDADGRPVAVISVCGPMERFSSAAQEAAAEPLLRVTRELSGRLGYASGALPSARTSS